MILTAVVVVFGFPLVNAGYAEDLKFAHLSDVHMNVKGVKMRGARLYPYSSELFNDAVAQINKSKGIEFVVVSGDLTTTSSKQELNLFLKIASKLKRPWYVSIGNHDIGIMGGIDKASFFNSLHKANPRIPAGKSYYMVSPKKGYVIFVMDGVIGTRITANGYFDKEQLDWLDNKLTEYKSSKAIIVQHFPLVEPYRSLDHKILNDDEYLAMLDKHNNVLAVLSGHYHGTKVTKRGSTVHVSTPALIEYPNAFRIITITEKSDRYSLKFDYQQTRLKKLQQMSKDKQKSPTLHEGSESDRNTTVEVMKDYIK